MFQKEFLQKIFQVLKGKTFYIKQYPHPENLRKIKVIRLLEIIWPNRAPQILRGIMSPSEWIPLESDFGIWQLS